MGTLFQCPSSTLLSDTGDIEFQVYEPVDHTERQAALAGTGAIMQGATITFFHAFSLRFHCLKKQHIFPN